MSRPFSSATTARAPRRRRPDCSRRLLSSPTRPMPWTRSRCSRRGASSPRRPPARRSPKPSSTPPPRCEPGTSSRRSTPSPTLGARPCLRPPATPSAARCSDSNPRWTPRGPRHPRLAPLARRLSATRSAPFAERASRRRTASRMRWLAPPLERRPGSPPRTSPGRSKGTPTRGNPRRGPSCPRASTASDGRRRTWTPTKSPTSWAPSRRRACAAS